MVPAVAQSMEAQSVENESTQERLRRFLEEQNQADEPIEERLRRAVEEQNEEQNQANESTQERLRRIFGEQNQADEPLIRERLQRLVRYNQVDERSTLQQLQRQLGLVQAGRQLGLVQAGENRREEASVLNRVGNLYSGRGDDDDALAYYQQALAIYQDIGDQREVGTSLNNVGRAYSNQGDTDNAFAYYERALDILQNIGDQNGVADTLNNIGDSYERLGNIDEALAYYERALDTYRAASNYDYVGEAGTLNNIGGIYERLGDPGEAIFYYWHAEGLLSSHQGPERVLTLVNIASISSVMGRATDALYYYRVALDIQEVVDADDKLTIGWLRNGIGSANDALWYDDEALYSYQRALDIFQDIGHQNGVAATLNNIGGIYYRQEKYDEALYYYQRSLAIFQDIGDLYSEGLPLHNIGLIHSLQGNDDEALYYYQRSLAIQEAIGDQRIAAQDIKAGTLISIADWFETQGQPTLAIIYFKQAINIYETIRSASTGTLLESDFENSYLPNIEGNYRALADLLLVQGRIPEAQQVLDLLKLEELREFTDTRATWTSDGIAYTTVEEPVIAAHGSLMALSATLVECESTRCADLDRLLAQQESLLAQYNAIVARFTETIQANRGQDEIFQDPRRISGEAKTLLRAYADKGQTPVLIYPFVLPDKLWLVWVTVGDVVGSVEVPVSQGELSTTVQHFGELLQDYRSDLAELQATSHQLYDWLIQPLATELNANDIDHLVFVNDRVTRYIPMAALYDGEQYLVDRYTLSTVLAPVTTYFDDALGTVNSSSVLGLGLTQAVSGFNPLPAVYAELNAIVQNQSGEGIYPGQVLLDEEFTLDSLKANVADHRILHLATHAEFVPGRAQESYIVLGDGSHLKIPDIDTMQRRLENLHLVVLSACQTALGGANQDGTEIAGLSSYFLQANRAEAVVASLWAVSDGGTSLLMQRFYEYLASGQYSKADALRQAQHSFLESNETVEEVQRIIGQRQTQGQRSTPLSHPYYWAPFIMIGNGL
ncbi:MAG: tetratricopeptide repeat protein [Leptolyngbyaceae cyanobacterium]